jgi:hypothetical protein
MRDSRLAALRELDDEQLVGVIVSENLFRGGDMGYCLVVTRDAIMGARKPESLADFEAYLGPGGNATDAARAEARKIAEALAGAREFLISGASVGQVLFKRPSMFFGGYVIIKTALSSIRIDTAIVSTNSPFLLETSKKLEASLEAVVGERLHDMGKTRG